MPGTTSHAMPAASSAAISSCARPNSIGSPPFSRTTIAMLARRIDQPLVDELLRGRVLAAALADGDLFRARRPARRSPDARAHRGTRCRRRSSSRAARSVSRSGAPGPGADEIDGAASSDHPRGDGAVGRLVDQDEAAGRAIVVVAVGERSAARARAHAWPMSFIASASGAGSCCLRRHVPAVIDAGRCARAPRASCGAADTCGARSSARSSNQHSVASMRPRGVRRAGRADEHVAARHVDLVVQRQRHARRAAARACSAPS